jgi:hypothetical protein
MIRKRVNHVDGLCLPGVGPGGPNRGSIEFRLNMQPPMLLLPPMILLLLLLMLLLFCFSCSCSCSCSFPLSLSLALALASLSSPTPNPPSSLSL